MAPKLLTLKTATTVRFRERTMTVGSGIASIIHCSARAARCGPVVGATLLAAALLCAAVPTLAQSGGSLRLMLHPGAAPRGQLSADRQAQLEAIAGTALTLTATTRTGALELDFAEPRDEASVTAIIKRLREDRDVLWAEPVRPRADVEKIRPKSSSRERVQKLMVRLADGVAPDWDALAPRFSAALGVPLAPDRQIGNVWVLTLAQAQTPERLTALAETLQQDPIVQYADPVLRKHALAEAVSNDPLFDQQWGLSDLVSGINVSNAWAIGSGLPGITVAVVDTGILPHPDLAGRILPGFDFVSDAENARDGNGRDSDPRDEGDWKADGDCGGFPSEDSFWHGTFIAGQIAANTNNGIGIAGIASNASIVPVRVLGKCGGTDEDVFEGMLWAAGVEIAGVAPNANPAKVINLSLGGFGNCTQAIQEAIDGAMAQGAVVVAAAGNDAADVAAFSPANCSGVITVGAHNRAGERTFYSNFGRRIDLSAPSGDGGLDDSTLSTANDGKTVPGNPSFDSGIGTSFAAPLVSGVASLMLSKNALLTPGRLLSVLQGSAREFAQGSPCRTGDLCGIGLLDAGVAVASTPPSADAAPPGTVVVVEYYRSDLDHYFITADANEIAFIDTDPAALNKRTGNVFFAWNDPALAPPDAVPVCRFRGSYAQLIDSLFFSPIAAECQYVLTYASAAWTLENPAAFWVVLADANGNCRAGMVPVYRFSNNRHDYNQRFTTDLSVRRAMINRAWTLDGYAPNGAAFCSPV